MTDILKTKSLTPEDLERFPDDYYDERDWDTAAGIPTREKLEELGLKDVADDLGERGILLPKPRKGWAGGYWGTGWS